MAGGEDAGFVQINRRLIFCKKVEAEELVEFSRKREAVKDPYFCYTASKWFEANAEIDCVVVSVRDFRAAAKSALSTGLAIWTPFECRDWIPSAAELAEEFETRYRTLMKSIEDHGAKCVEVEFPRSVNDSGYLFGRLREVMPDLAETRFLVAFENARDRSYKP